MRAAVVTAFGARGDRRWDLRPAMRLRWTAAPQLPLVVRSVQHSFPRE
jgi:hypothetical protein